MNYVVHMTLYKNVNDIEKSISKKVQTVDKKEVLVCILKGVISILRSLITI